MKALLITGGLGFIGSNLLIYLLTKYPNYVLINLDKLTYAGSLNNVKDIVQHPRYKFIQGDICNRELVQYIFFEYDIRGVINLAAETHVDNSIKQPDVFLQTNVLGTFTLLDTAYKYWMVSPSNYKSSYENCMFHHISTDEVYGSLGETGAFNETTPYAPNSPYSASKASSDMVVRSYYHTYAMNTVITNCSNNYGPKQHDEKLIPTIIRNALLGSTIPIYGDGSNIRDWLHVNDHCEAIDLVFHCGKKGSTYNVGSDNEQTNLEIAQVICAILDEMSPKNISYSKLIEYVEDRAGHDKRYAVDASKIDNELGWSPNKEFEIGIRETVDWYLKYYKNKY